VLVAPLSSASPQEEKQGLQKDVPSEGSSIKSTLNQDEWEIKTIPINTFWIKKKKKKKEKKGKGRKVAGREMVVYRLQLYCVSVTPTAGGVLWMETHQRAVL
jgi:hypothetical protein